MPVTVVVGGQFGSEGKGKVAYYFASEMHAAMAVRVGGPNSGHTVVEPNGKRTVFRQLPTAAVLPDVICVLPAGSYIDLDILLIEINSLGITPDRLKIDPNAVVVTQELRLQEKQSNLRSSIGSTASGTGAAVRARIERCKSTRFVIDEPLLQPFISRTSDLMRGMLDKGTRIIIEGTQGFGLSILHSRYYPFTTSRDTSASGFVSEAGLSPLDVDDVILVLRAMPIRVPGNSGPLSKETDWETVTRESASPIQLIEYTSVTHTVRRIARFDAEVVCQAITVNRPSRIILNHVDYVDATSKDGEMTLNSIQFIRDVENSISRKVDYFGLGPASLCHNAYHS